MMEGNPDLQIMYVTEPELTREEAALECIKRRGVLGVFPTKKQGFFMLTEFGEIWSTYFEMYLSRCLLYTSPSPRDRQKSRMPSSA